MHKEEDRRLGRVFLQRVEAVAIIRRVLDSIMRADLKNVNQHADVLENGRALRREVGVHERVLPAAVPEVEDEVAQETDVVLLDVDGRAEARGERGGIVGAVHLKKLTASTTLALLTSSIQGAGDAQNEGAHGGFPAPRCAHEKDLGPMRKRRKRKEKGVSEMADRDVAPKRTFFFTIRRGESG